MEDEASIIETFSALHALVFGEGSTWGQGKSGR